MLPRDKTGHASAILSTSNSERKLISLLSFLFIDSALITGTLPFSLGNFIARGLARILGIVETASSDTLPLGPTKTVCYYCETMFLSNRSLESFPCRVSRFVTPNDRFDRSVSNRKSSNDLTILGAGLKSCESDSKVHLRSKNWWRLPSRRETLIEQSRK